MQEEWREVKGYEGLYSISNMGRIYSHISHKYLKLQGKAYLFITLVKGLDKHQYYVHRLVANAFLPNPNPDVFTELNHKDEDKTNNCVTNLEWCTHKYNCQYGTRNYRVGLPQATAVKMYDLEGCYIAQFVTIRRAAEVVGVSHALIIKACEDNKYQAGGYKWRYADV